MEHEKTNHRPLGFGRWEVKWEDAREPIPPGAIAEFVARPQLACVGERVHVEMDCARYFDILDIRVGMRSLFMSADPIPADTYALVLDDDGKPQRHQDNRLASPPMNWDSFLFIRVQNLGEPIAARHFRASVLVREIVNADWQPTTCANCGAKQPGHG